MALGVLAGVVKAATSVASKWITQKGVAKENEAEIKKQELQLENAIASAINNSALAQAEINKVEAAHKSLFVAGWRPFIGWSFGVGIAWGLVGQNFVAWALIIAGFQDIADSLPMIELEKTYPMILGMLGIIGVRGWEKKEGVARNS